MSKLALPLIRQPGRARRIIASMNEEHRERTVAETRKLAALRKAGLK